jgi:opacity protein-like surface antigen
MKKILLTAVSSLLIFSSAFSQADDRNGYIAISIGANLPDNDFGSKNENNQSAGYANTGGILNASFAYKLAGNFGVAARIQGQSNAVDNGTIVNQWSEKYPNVNWTASSDSWQVGSLMGGIYGGFPLDGAGKVLLEIRGLIGVLHATIPQVTVTGEMFGVSESGTQQSAEASAFSYLGGAGLRFNLGESVGLLFNADYIGSNPEFNNVVTTTTLSTTSTRSISMQYGAIDLGVGIAFLLK